MDENQLKLNTESGAYGQHKDGIPWQLSPDNSARTKIQTKL
jgi:hypothetical protein